MGSNQETMNPHILRVGGAAAVKEGCRILATTFLSLLIPLSFLLLARLSVARYFLSVTNDKPIQPHAISFLTSVFMCGKITLILSLLISFVSIAALTNCVSCNKAASLISERRRRLFAAWVLLFLIQVCLSLGILGTIEADINSYTVGRLVLPRRLIFVLGLHETMVFWCRNVVKLLVDETIFGISSEDFSWVEKVAMAVALGNLWWRRLREEAEALVMLPWVMVELRMDIGVADVLGCWLYYLTVAVGVVRVVKSFIWQVTWIVRRHPIKKENNGDIHDLNSIKSEH